MPSLEELFCAVDDFCQQFEPRWRQGQLCCGYPIRKVTENQPEQYQCCMGFRIAYIK